MEGYQNYFFRNGNSLEAILLERESTVFVCLYHLQIFFLAKSTSLLWISTQFDLQVPLPAHKSAQLSDWINQKNASLASCSHQMTLKPSQA